MQPKPPIVYSDGVRIIAASTQGYHEVLYGISQFTTTSEVQVVLSQDEARELAAALTWIISEVDAQYGRPSFKPHHRKERAAKPTEPNQEDAYAANDVQP